MKYLTANLGFDLFSITCVIVAGWLAVNGKEGWGYFLLVGFVCAGSVSFSYQKDKDDKKDE